MVGVVISRRASWRRIAGRGVAAVVATVVAGPAAAGLSSLSGLPGGSGGLALTARIDTSYDSNLLRNAGAAVLNPSSHQDDFRYSPSANAAYSRDTGRIALRVNGTIGRDYFQNNSGLSRGYYTAGGTATYRSGGGCQLVVNGNYANRQNTIQGNFDPIDETITTLPDDVGRVIDNVQTTTNYGANARCGSASGRLSFGGGYAHSSFANAAATRRFADSDSDSYSGDIGIGILRPGQLSITGSYSTIGYPNRAVAVPGFVPPSLVGSGPATYRIGLSFSRPIGSRLNGSIGASYLHANSSNGVAPYSAPAYNIGLNYTAGSRLTLNLTGSRDAVSSTTAVASYRVVDQITLGGHYKLGRAIMLDSSASLVNSDYRQGIAIPGEPARLTESSKTFSVGATFRPRPLYDVALTASKSIRTSNPSTFNYNSIRAGLTLAVHI